MSKEIFAPKLLSILRGFIIIIFLLLVGCEKQKLDTELEKAIQEY